MLARLSHLKRFAVMYDLKLTRKAQKFYEKAETSLARRLNQCFEQLREDPYNSSSVKALRGNFEGCFRYRIGEYRVIYKVDEVEITDSDGKQEIITILLIAHRRDIYRDR